MDRIHLVEFLLMNCFSSAWIISEFWNGLISGQIKYSKMSSTRSKIKTNLFTSALLLNMKRKKKEPRRKLKRWNINCIINYLHSREKPISIGFT